MIKIVTKRIINGCKHQKKKDENHEDHNHEDHG
jgi:hypothetical protein